MYISKIIKKYVAIMLVIALMATSSSSIAFASNGDREIYGNYLIETIANESDGTYAKLKITNIITNEIEWLESFSNEDGTNRIVAQTGNGEEYLIETDKEKIVITLYGEVVDEILLNDETAETDNLVMPFAYGAWSNPVVTYYNTNIAAGNVSLIIAIVASVMGLSTAASIVVSIATYLASSMLTTMYYKDSTRTRYDWDNYLMQREITTTVYSDSSYSKSLGSNTRVVTLQMQTR